MNRRDRENTLAIDRHRRAIAYWLVGIVSVLSFTAHPEPLPGLVFPLMLFAHIAAVIVGLGAAVVLDLVGLGWAIGRARLDDMRRLERPLSAVLWLAIIALFVTGTFLDADLNQPLTWVKMTAVTVAALNGVAVGRLTRALGRLPADTRFAQLPGSMQRWCMSSGLVSQAAWWTAVLVGVLNTASH